MNQYKQHHMSKQELKENKLVTMAVDFRHFLIRGTKSAARACYHLGAIQYAVQGYLKAIQSFRIAAENGAGHIAGASLIGIGDAYSQLNNPKKALESYQMVLDGKYPGFSGLARSKAIQVLIALGRFPEARRQINQLKEDRETRFAKDVPRLLALVSLFEKNAGITSTK